MHPVEQAFATALELYSDVLTPDERAELLEFVCAELGLAVRCTWETPTEMYVEEAKDDDPNGRYFPYGSPLQAGSI